MVPYGRLVKHEIPSLCLPPFTLGLSQHCCLTWFLTRPNCGLLCFCERKINSSCRHTGCIIRQQEEICPRTSATREASHVKCHVLPQQTRCSIKEKIKWHFFSLLLKSEIITSTTITYALSTNTCVQHTVKCKHLVHNNMKEFLTGTIWAQNILLRGIVYSIRLPLIKYTKCNVITENREFFYGKWSFIYSFNKLFPKSIQNNFSPGQQFYPGLWFPGRSVFAHCHSKRATMEFKSHIFYVLQI